MHHAEPGVHALGKLPDLASDILDQRFHASNLVAELRLRRQRGQNLLDAADSKIEILDTPIEALEQSSMSEMSIWILAPALASKMPCHGVGLD